MRLGSNTYKSGARKEIFTVNRKENLFPTFPNYFHGWPIDEGFSRHEMSNYWTHFLSSREMENVFRFIAFSSSEKMNLNERKGNQKKSGRVASQHKLVNKLVAQLFSFLEESSKEVEQIFDEFVGANVLQVCSCQRSVDTTDDVTWNSINKADFFLYFLKSSANLWDYLLPVHISTCVVCWRAQTNSSTAQKATNAGWCHNQQRRKDNYKAHLSSNCATI